MGVVAKSHICPSCLTELARIRAVPDQHYGLPIVVCPGCSKATVRTRHPDIEYWRGVRRFQWAMRNLLAKLVLTVLAGLVFWALVMASEDIFTPGGGLDLVYPYYSGDPGLAIGASMMMGVSVVLMMILVLLYAHRSIFFAVCVFVLVSLFFVTIEYQALWANHALGLIAGFDPDIRLPRGYEIRQRFERFGFLGGVSLLGIVPAFLLRGISSRGDARRFRRLLRKRRKMKTIHD